MIKDNYTLLDQKYIEDPKYQNKFDKELYLLRAQIACLEKDKARINLKKEITDINILKDQPISIKMLPIKYFKEENLKISIKNTTCSEDNYTVDLLKDRKTQKKRHSNKPNEDRK